MTDTKIKDCRFHHIAIRASDFDKSLAFYVQGLGFKKVIQWGEGEKRGVMLDIGDGNCIEIFAGGSKTDIPENKWLHLAFGTTDCDGAFNLAVAAGAGILKVPYNVDMPSEPVTKIRIAFVKGPDDEEIEFFQYRK